MQSKLYQSTPYNFIDNNFYNFKIQDKFNQFLNKIEKPIIKEVSIIKLESYNKIMYKIKFENETEEKTFCGFKYMNVDNKYWFITNFEVKKNNNSGFITYYAQLDHWATQWLTVKKHIHNNIKEKSLYIERLHQTRWFYNKKENKLYINYRENSPYHLEEKIQINNYIAEEQITLNSDIDIENDKNINKINKCYYYLRWQLKKPYINYDHIIHNKKLKKINDFVVNHIFIFLNDDNMEYYLNIFNPEYMIIFSTVDNRWNHTFLNIFNNDDDIIDKLSGDSQPKINDEYIIDLHFYRSHMFSISHTLEQINIKDIKLDFVSNNYDYKKNIKNELIFKNYPYSKYFFIKGNNMKEYKINQLLYSNDFDMKIKMKYRSFISYNIYNLWIYPDCGFFINDYNNYKNYLLNGLNITNNLELSITSNSYKTYSQNNLNSLQTNINQAEQTRRIANQEATIGLITGTVTTALGVALAPFTFGASLGLATGGAVYTGQQTNKWINNQIKNNFEIDSLNAKINDMKNLPNTITTINNDYSWLTYFNDDILSSSKTVSKILIVNLTLSDKNILFDWYYYNGYLFNRYTNELNFDENRNRYILNFYKIKDIRTLLATCPEICNEDIEWWNNTFQQGIIVWETEDSLKLYDQQIYIGNNKYENWETELLKIDYVLQKIKESKPNPKSNPKSNPEPNPKSNPESNPK